MDYEKLAQLLVEQGLYEKLSDPFRPRSGALNRKEQIRLLIAAEVTKKSLADCVRTAIFVYLNSNQEKHLDAFRLEAAAEGKNLEEYVAEKIRLRLETDKD